MELISETCPCLFSGFWPPPPFRALEASISMSERCNSSLSRLWVALGELLLPTGPQGLHRETAEAVLHNPQGLLLPLSCVISCTA